MDEETFFYAFQCNRLKEVKGEEGRKEPRRKRRPEGEETKGIKGGKWERNGNGRTKDRKESR